MQVVVEPPLTTQSSPTVGHRWGSCRAVAPEGALAQHPCTDRCRLSYPGQGPASSSNALAGTENPHHRSVSTHSNCWPPTCRYESDVMPE